MQELRGKKAVEDDRKVRSEGKSAGFFEADSAVRSGCANLRIWLTAGVGLAADLWSKCWAVAVLGRWSRGEGGAWMDGERLSGLYGWAVERFGQPNQGHPEGITVIQDTVMFYLGFNKGASWGIAAGQTKLLLIGSGVAMLFMLWLYVSLRRQQRIGQIALGMLFAGALGNTYDRVFNAGRVVDFIRVDLRVWPANPWPTFNVADSLLCVGVAMLMLSLLFGQKGKENV